MKHLKTYENINQEIWAVINVPQTGIGDVSIELFEDEKSAENKFIDTVNEIAKDDAYTTQHFKDKYKEYDNDDIIFTIEDANKFLENNDYNVEYKKLYINKKYELPEELKIGRSKRKYNL